MVGQSLPRSLDVRREPAPFDVILDTVEWQLRSQESEEIFGKVARYVWLEVEEIQIWLIVDGFARPRWERGYFFVERRWEVRDWMRVSRMFRSCGLDYNQLNNPTYEDLRRPKRLRVLRQRCSKGGLCSTRMQLTVSSSTAPNSLVLGFFAAAPKKLSSVRFLDMSARNI